MKKTFVIVSILSGIGLLIINWLIGKAKLAAKPTAKFALPLRRMVIRQDAKGSGSFWASRIGRYHEGIDLECTKGETVFSPISGIILRKAFPYANDLRFEGCVIYNATTDTEIKFFYMVANKIGKNVAAGEPIGYCQAINEKYDSTMKNHLHLEIREKGRLLNPESVYNIT